MLIAVCPKCGSVLTSNFTCFACGEIVRINADQLAARTATMWMREMALNDGIQAEGWTQELLDLRAENAALKAQVRELQKTLEEK